MHVYVLIQLAKCMKPIYPENIYDMLRVIINGLLKSLLYKCMEAIIATKQTRHTQSSKMIFKIE